MSDAFRPEAPLPPHFDAARQAWIFSRYADVSTALREPALQQASAGNELTAADPTEHHATVMAAVQNDLTRMSTTAWRSQMKNSLQSLLLAHRGRNTDLVRDILHPWSTSLLLQLIGAQGTQAEELTSLSTRMFHANAAATANPSRSIIARFQRKFIQIKKKRDSAAIQQLSHAGIIHTSTFAGLTQTLPGFLAKAWLALLESPEQADELAVHPEAIAGATEELLRYSGIVHTLYRRASKNLNVGEANILEGQQVILRLASANFDPERFERPNQLDLLRKPLANLGLGTGLHACVGAVLVRQACTVTTPVFLAAGASLEHGSDIHWTVDNTLRWPSSILIRLK